MKELPATLNGLSGVRGIMLRSLIQIVRRPIYWAGFFLLPLFMFLFISSLLHEGLPTRIPSAIVDKDGTTMSRHITQNLSGMQMVDITDECNSYSQARHLMQEGKIYGFFLIPENFQADMLAGRRPVITFYTNMTYFVPGTMLFKTFKLTATYAKVGVLSEVAQSVGLDPEQLAPYVQPVNIQARGIGNPELNYGIYLANSFIPCCLQLMILLITAFSICQEMKYGTSRRLMHMAAGSVVKAMFGKLFPQTVIWWVITLFMYSWLFKYNGYTMQGSWFWMLLSGFMFVPACQGFALFVVCVLPNLRLSLSICSLLGILSFSIAAFSFPVQSMYGALAIFSYIVPIRYNFLIYGDQALNGFHIYYSRIWFVAYIVFMPLPFTMLWRLKKELKDPAYVP